MAFGPMQTVIRHLRRVVIGSGDGSSDSEWLERFVTCRDQDAFAALVGRHGPMVFGVCRRVAGNAQDAEDAFQATFVVLARKAGSLGEPELLGNWLYGVAYRTALKARARAARRRTLEQQVEAMPHPEVEPQSEWQELQPLLDQALSRLPDKYRVPVVLCDLEGRPRSEVARQLRLPEGTLSSRLATARKMLAERLGRHGLTLSAGSLAVVLAENAASAGVPASLMGSTVEAATLVAAGQAAAGVLSAEAAVLSEEVLRAMFWSKWKFAATLLLSFAVLGTSAGFLAVYALADKPVGDKPVADKPDKPKEPAADKPKQPAADKPKDPNAADAGDKKPQAPGVSGVLLAIDPGKSITVRVPANDGTKQSREEKFDLAKDVKVLLADIVSKDASLPEGKLGDLSEGTAVALLLTEDKKLVTTITARGPDIQAAVKAVNPGQNTITLLIATKKDGQKDTEEKTFTLVKDIRVVLIEGLKKNENEQEGKLADLTEGTRIHAQLSVNQRTVLAIRVQAATLQGRLKGVDNGTQTITITVKEDGNLVDKSFPLAKDAQLLDLTEGAGVSLRFSVFDRTKVIVAQGQKDKPEQNKKE